MTVGKATSTYSPKAQRAATFLALAASSAAGSAAATFFAGPAGAATANSMHLLQFGGNDQIYNYDFLSQTVAANNADWHVSFMFTNNAEIDKVKNTIDDDYPNAGGIMYARQKDEAALGWDSDRGLKNPAGSCPDNRHMRFYADPNDDRMFNLGDGFYIFATVHKDINENCAGEEFGWSEDAEAVFAQDFRDRGFDVDEDAVNFSNPEPNRWQGNHFWMGNGLVTYVDIP